MSEANPTEAATGGVHFVHLRRPAAGPPYGERAAAVHGIVTRRLHASPTAFLICSSTSFALA
ncbi:hypothetical protein, partial [Ramlibacter sp.]|uniref:hypothetical protein n=1 Tax=Ramlibacter sp. TaxID=1917967 RepID=UPI002D8097A2